MSRRCLICANINPCRQHSDNEQLEELRRNDAEIKELQHHLPAHRRMFK